MAQEIKQIQYNLDDLKEYESTAHLYREERDQWVEKRDL